MAELVKKALDFLRAHPELKPYKGGSFSLERQGVYNPKYFDLKKDHLVDEAGNIIASKDLAIPKENLSWEVPAQADPNKIFRGMSAEEFANFQKNNYLQSLGTHNIGEGQKGLTYFSTNPSEARSYASAFAPREFAPDPSRPAYVVAAKRPSEENIAPQVPGTGESEVGVRGQVPRSDVTNVYRGNVVDYLEGMQDKYGSVSPRSAEHWEEIHDYAHGGHVDAALHMLRRHFNGDDGSYVDPDEPRPLTIYRGNAPVADEAGGSGREPTPAPPAFSYMPTPESVARQAARQPAYNPAERTWSDAGSTEGERLTRALGVEDLPKGETFMSAQPTGWEKYKPQLRQGTYLKRTGEAFGENADAVTEGLKAIREGNYGAGALGMVGGGLGMAMSPLTGMERVLVRDPYLRMTGNLKDAQAAEMVADTALTGGVRGMVTPFAKAGSLGRMATEPWNKVRMPSPAVAGAATAAGAMLAPEDAEASKLSKAMETARMAIPRELTPLGFYSHGAEAARGMAQTKGTPQQFRSMLEKAGVKGPEMESYLQTFGGKPIVTKEEIAQHFQQNLPQIEERVLHSDDAATKFGDYALPGGENYREVLLKLPTEATPIVDQKGGSYGFTDPSGQRRNYWSQQEAEQAAKSFYRGSGEFKSSHWDDPNVLAHMRMSDRTGPNGEKVLHVEEVQSDWGQEGKREGFKQPPNPSKEAPLQEAKQDAQFAWEKARSDFLKGHEDYQKALQDRTMQMAERWGLTPEEVAADQAKAAQEWASMTPRQKLERAHSEFSRSENPLELPHYAARDAEVAAAQVRDKARNDLFAYHKSVDKGLPTAPYVTSTQGWTDLALKRALNEAAEGGYDRIVFTPGAEQAKRYDLSKQIEDVTLHGSGDNLRLSATAANGNHKVIDMQHVTPQTLPNYVGQEVANKLLAMPEPNPNNPYAARSLFGLDLQTGGEGMKGYYDKILPKRLQELVKKHDPEARVGAHEIPNSGDKLRSTRGDVGELMNWHPAYTNLSRQEQSARWNTMTVPERQRLMADYEKAQSDDIVGHGVEITPAMRESILRGQSAHARGGSVVDHALMLVSRQA